MASAVTLERVLAGLCLALLAGLAALPLAAAQVPTDPLIQVQIEGEPSDQIVKKLNGVLTYTFTVSFDCSTGTGRGPCTGQLGDTQVQVEITETRKASYPMGWEIKAAPLSFRIPADATEVVTVTVTLEEEEPEDSEFTVELRANARPIVESPAGGGLGDLLNDQGSQSSTASDSVQGTEELTTAEQLVGFGRRFMWPLMGAAAVLMLAGVILVERRRGSIEVSCDQPQQEILPGRGVSFPVRIRNSTKESHRFGLRVSELPAGWTAILPLDEIDLPANDETQFYVSIKAPPTATPGEAVQGELRVRALRGATLEESTTFRVTVAQDPYSSATFSAPPTPSAPPGPAPSIELPAPEPLSPDDVSFLEEDAPAKAAAKRKKPAPKDTAGKARRR